MSLITKLSEQTIASAATISPTSDILLMTGTTSIATIRPPFQGFSGRVIIIPLTGTVATVTTGNIALAVNMVIDKAAVLYYSKTQNKWYPGAVPT